MLQRAKGTPPLYAQVAETVRDRIRTRRLQPGDRLDSEPALTRQFGVSRATVTKALDLLEREGLVRREQGRGTFVARPHLDRQLPELTGFSEHMAALGLTPGQRLVTFERHRATAKRPLLAAFPVGIDVIVVRRVRLADGSPVGIHSTAIPAPIAEQMGLRAEQFDSSNLSLYALFEAAGIALDRAEEHLRADAADPEEAVLLGVAPGTPIMHVRRLTRDSTGQLLEAVDARYLGGFYDYHIELVRKGTTGAPQLVDLYEGGET